MMTNRVMLVAAVASMLAASPTLAAPFPAVGDGFMGTEFRGLALGQNRAEVELALAENGFRCLTAEEDVSPQRPDTGYTTCPIVPSDFVVDAMGKTTLFIRYDLQQQLGLPYNAVAFIDGIASAMTLETGYFNADGSTPYYFAEQIIDNYGIQNGMTTYNFGWRGTTANDEEVQVQTFYNGRATVLVVLAATEQSSPAFD